MKKLSNTLRLNLLLSLLLIGFSSQAQTEEIRWISFEEAVALSEKEPRKIIVDVYTDWCGWCKRMDASTFKNPVIVKYINDHYYAVKLNAERKDTIQLGNQIFVNKNPEGRRAPHDLAVALLNGKMTYPSIVYLDESVELMHPAIAGYQNSESLEQIIKYFGENAYKSTPWETYQSGFVSEISAK